MLAGSEGFLRAQNGLNREILLSGKKSMPVSADNSGRFQVAYFINENCISCGACAGECPVSCIKEGSDKFVIDENVCISCGACAGVCPVDAPKEK